jgi:hypothetical protein
MLNRLSRSNELYKKLDCLDNIILHDKVEFIKLLVITLCLNSHCFVCVQSCRYRNSFRTNSRWIICF